MFTPRSSTINSERGLMSAYLRDVRKYEPLSNEEQVDLVTKYRNGEGKEKYEAAEKLILTNQRFIISYANKYGVRDTYQDLVSEGNIGLMEAMDKFDPSKGYKFLSYASFWINKRIQEYITSNYTVRPKNSDRLFPRIMRLKRQFFAEHGREATDDEIADLFATKYNTTISRSDTIIPTCYSLSDYESVSENHDSDTNQYKAWFNEYERVSATNNTDDVLEEMEKRELANIALSLLDDDERTVIENLYGFGQYQMTENQCSEKMGLSLYKVRKLHRTAMKKMDKQLNHRK